MRAPTRLLAFSLLGFITLMIILSRFQSETFTNTINKFPKIKEAYYARSAAVQSRLGSGSTSSSSSSSSSSSLSACDIDAKTCSEPYTSKDPKTKDKESEYTDQTSTSSEYDKDKKQKDKDRRPSTKDDDRDADRGFTDAEQAAALERLEYKYGEEAKDKNDPARVLWMESSTTSGWDAERTEALDPEAEKALKILGEEYGDAKATATSLVDDDDDDDNDDDLEGRPREKGWRTTGFETKAKATQKTLISGGGGNGTSTKTDFSSSTSSASSTTHSMTKVGITSTTAKATSTTSQQEKPNSKGQAKAKGQPKYDVEDEEGSKPTTSKGRWDDEAPELTREASWDEEDEEDDDYGLTSKKGRYDD